MVEDRQDAPKRPMTARQLASLIGVSQSAVSRAFTPSSSISPKLRERILKSAREIDYHPNAIASMLTKQKTNIVGVVVSDVRNPFYPVLIEHLIRELQKVGLQSLMFYVTPGARIEEQLVAIRTYNVDAVVVIAATILPESELAWATQGRKAVLLTRQGEENLTTICCDNAAGSRAIVDHFHEIGCQKIGYVAGLTKSGVGFARHNAFVTRLAELGMRLAGTVSEESYSYDAGWRGALELSKEKPDAIYFASDILALGGMDALRREKGISIPDDIVVAGFDDIEMASWPNYDLTTYKQPISKLVAETIGCLVSDKKVTNIHIAIPGELIVRTSSSRK